MRDAEQRSHGQMKTKSGRMAAPRMMSSSNSVSSKSYAEEEDPRVKDMWDEEFFGHELPPKYKISRSRTPEGQEKRKDPDGRRDVVGERAMWDEEFWGHRLPPNYTISRFRTPEGLEKRKEAGTRREAKEVGAGEQLDRYQRHTKIISEDTFEYNFDKTVDSYVLSEEISGTGKEDWGLSKRAAAGSVLGKEEGSKVESFEERALRFGVEDWNLVGKKWTQCDSKGSRRSARRGIFHSPSGSDTSSLVSTLESSSFSCGSEGSSFAKTEFSSASFNLSHVYGMPGGVIPLSAPGGRLYDGAAGVGQFVELNVSAREHPEVLAMRGSDSKDGSSYFEFNFLDGKMVEREDGHGLKDGKGDENADCKASSRTAIDDPSPAATAQSPESENFFDTSHDSDWSGTQSVSTNDQGPTTGRDAERGEFDEDNTSIGTEDRACEDWSGDIHFYDVDPCDPLSDPPSSCGNEGRIELLPSGESKPAVGESRSLELERVPSGSALSTRSSDEEKRSARSPTKRIQSTPRKTRSLGSVLSHHLAFTAVPSLRYKSQPPCNFGDQKESPAKVTAACIEWLWSEKDVKKPVQALRALADRENAERERLSSPPVRNLDSAFRESKTHSLGRLQPAFCSRGPPAPDSLKSPASVAPRDPAKESRDSILASWAVVYGSEVSPVVRPKRPSSIASSKGAQSAPPPSKQPSLAKTTISPRKRSVSFSAHVGSKPGNALTKPVSKNLALELEVLCRPFGPVLKGVRFLPTAKRGLGRSPLFSNLGPQLATSSSTLSASLPSVLKCGRLQCVLTREGLPSYSLIMDDTEEIFAAKTLRVDTGLQEGVSHLYTFHSFKGKGKGKSGWRQWGKKEKPGSDFAGNMTVTSTICPVVTSSGVQNFVESEFVLFDAKVKEISISGPTTASPYPRSSVSSWDTATTPQRSPQGPSSTYSSPSSTYFSLPSPVPAGAFTTPVHGAAGISPSVGAPSHSVSLSMPGVVGFRGSMSLDKGVARFKQLERHMSMESPLHSSLRMANFGFRDSLSDSEAPDDYECRSTFGLPHSQSELAAVVVRTPLEKSQGKVAPTGDKWGWGINFLRKSFDSARSSPDQGVAAVDADASSEKAGSICEGTHGSPQKWGSGDQRCTVCGNSSGDEQGHGGLNITLILPTGEHGCSTNGIDGPQPLIERWRSGGKCDCGSWDLGCGLTIVGNQRGDDKDSSGGKPQPRDNSSLRLFLEGKKQPIVGLALTPLKEGCYTLGFQAPISPLHAFATAVAVLHSKNPITASKKGAESRRRLTRIPVKVVPAASRSFTRQIDEPSGSRSLVSYKLVCPDPPSSPFGRA